MLFVWLSSTIHFFSDQEWLTNQVLEVTNNVVDVHTLAAVLLVEEYEAFGCVLEPQFTTTYFTGDLGKDLAAHVFDIC